MKRALIVLVLLMVLLLSSCGQNKDLQQNRVFNTVSESFEKM
ncbi:MAG: hypothetical protein Q4E91_12855 [Lachnospiraceae bacterium]|nr:hypothetical protein [Lachnospiraceae bacterium]